MSKKASDETRKPVDYTKLPAETTIYKAVERRHFDPQHPDSWKGLGFGGLVVASASDYEEHVLGSRKRTWPSDLLKVARPEAYEFLEDCRESSLRKKRPIFASRVFYSAS